MSEVVMCVCEMVLYCVFNKLVHIFELFHMSDWSCVFPLSAHISV